MKNAIILQGAGETTESFWLPWLGHKLEEKGYKVWTPQLPDNDSPDLTKTLPFVLKNGEFNEETLMVGHSAGGPLILSVLENIKVKIKKAILVAGLVQPDPRDSEDIKEYKRKYLQEKYNWDLIKQHCDEFIFINSINDPWNCDDKQGRIMFDNLGGLLILNKEGHMGSDKFKQPIKELPLLSRLID